MIRSMTGFGRGIFQNDALNVTVEIKSVNHRYFEFSARMPRAYQFLEEKLKAYCQKNISRGKIEVSVLVEELSEGTTEVVINHTYAGAYINALKELSKTYKIRNDVKVSTLAGNSEIFKLRKNALPDEVAEEAVISALDEAINAFVEMRKAEGERLRADILSRAEYILSKVALVEKQNPETVKQYRERLEAKIRELIDNAQVDEQRLLTETAIFADKVAVDEETVRLRSHIKQLKELLDGDETVGKKLDFIVQEMNRETNTIGSKAQDVEIAHIVVDIKAEIEKIREQIQNIE